MQRGGRKGRGGGGREGGGGEWGGEAAAGHRPAPSPSGESAPGSNGRRDVVIDDGSGRGEVGRKREVNGV